MHAGASTEQRDPLELESPVVVTSRVVAVISFDDVLGTKLWSSAQGSVLN